MYILQSKQMFTVCKHLVKIVVLHVFELEFQAVSCCTFCMHSLHRATASKHYVDTLTLSIR